MSYSLNPKNSLELADFTKHPEKQILIVDDVKTEYQQGFPVLFNQNHEFFGLRD